jgi:hypothetical protein
LSLSWKGDGVSECLDPTCDRANIKRVLHGWPSYDDDIIDAVRAAPEGAYPIDIVEHGV